MTLATRRRKNQSGGQAIIMVTFALLAMCGMMGLAVDLGWSFFVKQRAQAVADAAAQAGVQEALFQLGGSTAGFTCASTMVISCQTTPANCDGIISGGSANYHNLYNGCQYAATNGFTTG